MRNESRDELRRMQDDLLAVPFVRQQAQLYGLHSPIWENGPTYLDLKNKLLPEFKEDFQKILLRAKGHPPG